MVALDFIKYENVQKDQLMNVQHQQWRLLDFLVILPCSGSTVQGDAQDLYRMVLADD